MAATSGNLELIKFLDEKMVPLNLANIDGQTPLDLALRSYNDLIAEYLSEKYIGGDT